MKSETTANRPERILVVDDSTTMRRIVIRILKDMGFTDIEEADNGRTALDMLREKNYDLAIADWTMPLMTGIELLKAVKSDDRLKDTPFIMVTAEGQKHNILEAVRSQVDQYVVKPFPPDLLTRKVSRILDRRRS